jgi:nucleoside-diphosphate-sugar epimerase
MKVLIAGARSALGSRVTALLRGFGHEVTGLSRTPAGPGFVVGDVLDAESTRRAVEHAAPDAIVQTLNALPKEGPRRLADLGSTARLRVEGTRNLLTAATAAGVTRYVAENFFFVYGGRPIGSRPVTEDFPIDAGTPETRSLDVQVREFGGVVLRCGLFYGAGLGSTDFLTGLVRRRRVPAIRGARNKYSYLHIDDAASAVVAALERGTPGTAYNVAGDVAAGPHDFIRALAQQAGAPEPRTMPLWLVRRFAGAYMTAALIGNLEMDNTRARTELGWTPAYPTIADGLKGGVAGPVSSAM